MCVHVDFFVAPCVFKVVRGRLLRRRYSARIFSFKTWLSIFALWTLPSWFWIFWSGSVATKSYYANISPWSLDTSVEAYPQTEYVSTSALFCPALTLTRSSRPGYQICRVTIDSLESFCIHTTMTPPSAALYVCQVTDVTYHWICVHGVFMIICVPCMHFVSSRRYFAV